VNFERMSNAGKMAAMSVCDGFKMLWRELPQDELARRKERLFHLVETHTDCPGGEITKHVKVKVLRASGEKRGGLVAVQVTGPAAAVFAHLPWSWAWSLSQTHFKTYADEVYQGATDGFADAMFHSEGYGQLSFFSAKKEQNRKKDGGQKGTRVGSRKSDVHTVVYKRQRERTGIETRVQDKALNRTVAAVEDITIPNDELAPDRVKFARLHSAAARHGFTKFLAELRRRGICLTTYFSSVTTEPDGATFPGTSIELSHSEEVSHMMPE
jgi:hypothetical protein